MAVVDLKIKVSSEDVDIFTAKVEAAAAYFERAPDDDPLKMEMAAFGEIDSDRDVTLTAEYGDGAFIVRVTPSPGLQSLLDMVPNAG